MNKRTFTMWLHAAAAKLRGVITKKNAQSVARAALAFIGGAVVAYGIAIGKLDVETAKLILKWIVVESGIDVPTVLVTTVGPIIWAAVRNKHEDKKVEGALELPAGSSRDDLAEHLAAKKGGQS